MGPNKMKRWKVDAYVGFGQIFYDSKAYDLTGGVKLRETGKKNDWIIPTGLAINYELTSRLDLGLDFRLNYTNSDYLDATWGGDYDRTPNFEFYQRCIRLHTKEIQSLIATVTVQL